MDRIMLRFRPIAPKPVGGGGGSDSKNVLVNNKRSKRKYVRVSKNNSGGYRRKKKTTTQVLNGTGSKDGTDDKMVTLQLLPERADSEDLTRTTSRCNYVDDKTRELEKPATPWLNLKNDQAVFDNCMVELGVTTSSDQTVAVETLVTVESVSSTADTSTCNNNMDFRGIGSTGGRLEMMMKLERDTCPAFISDGLNRVQWVNGAYKRMVMVRLLEKQEQSSAAETVTVLVSLVMKDKELKLPSSFTCKVSVEYRWQQKEKEMMKFSKMVVVPCDVWRIMEVGGFAWRLDVESALTLGR
ncbi:hypothetical protein EZV62_020061 [Acer yangbiense]|uniref:DUF7950 domain-containing protein n=1 Tax=Acer yangbiense TaxID=1000413 RepID=A0A5C7HDW2_9ROSI|nr:hypothetical protein EZV62_020061 [Acer yangbiense]